MLSRLLGAAALSVAALPALGATLAQTSGVFTLEAVGDVPAGISITAFDPVLDTASAADGPLSDTAASADGFTTSDTDEADFGDLSAAAIADTTGGGEAGSAFAESFVELPLFVQNTTDDFLTVSGLLTYDLSATVTIDDPSVDQASAGLLLEFVILGDVVFSEQVFADAGMTEDSAVGEFLIPLTLPGNFGAEVSLVAGATASSSDVSPVPLPAGLPLLAAALAGLAALRRRMG